MGCRHDARLKVFLEMVAQRGGRHKAVVTVTRKMLVSIYYVLNRNEPYRGGEDVGLRRRKVKGCSGKPASPHPHLS